MRVVEKYLRALLVGSILLVVVHAEAQLKEPEESILEAPARSQGEGPYNRLILQGVTLIDGTGAPPIGPMDIVIVNDRIVQIESVGFPGVPVDSENRPEVRPGDEVLDLDGHYVLPGFVDLHGHIGGTEQGTPAEYVFKLWMGHGITTISDPSTGNGLQWVLDHKKKSEANEITAPRIEAYPRFGLGSEGPMATPEIAREWVGTVAQMGADGIKFFGARPDIMGAALDEAKKHNLRSTCHHAQTDVSWLNVLDSARMGLTSMQHWYGLPEAMFEGQSVQNYPVDYNYNNEQDRFGQAGRLWAQAAKPFSDKWNEVMNELLELDFTLSPTFCAYETTRDFMRMARAEWHEEYTLPSLWRFYRPNRVSHGAYFFDWTTEDEVEWKNNYRLWMTFVNEYKNRGGRVAVGSDSGYTYNLYGFGHIREMELLREAGFHPLEVFRSATLKGAEALGLESEIGTVEVGKKADLVVVAENPLANIKVLYGTGAIRLNENNEPIRVGGVKYTIKDGIIFDAQNLLADVRRIVREAKERENFTITQPGRPTPQN